MGRFLLTKQVLKKYEKEFILLFVIDLFNELFTACSDDDDDKVVCPVPQTEFTVATGLNLTYNGGSMIGKESNFTPDASDAPRLLGIGWQFGSFRYSYT